MTSAQTAAATRHAHMHPGYTLITWEPVAMPVYGLTADLVLQQEKPLPPVDEFVLEAIDAGLSTVEGIGGLLGLEQHVVNYAVTKQIMQDHVVVVPRSDRPQAELALTPIGVTALDSLRYTVPAREQYRLVFDRLLWQVIPRRLNDLMRPREHKDRDLVILPKAERRQTTAADIRTADVARLVNREGGNGVRVDVLAVSAVVRQEARHLEGLLLVFASDSFDDLRFEVVVDGVVSARHSEALARDGRTQQLPYQMLAPAPPLAMHGALMRACVPIDEVREANKAALRSRRHVQEASGGEPNLRADAAPAPVGPDEPHVRSIETWEHRVLLEDAVRAARRRVLILTPGVSREVVDGALLSALDRLAERRVDVRIGIGPDAGIADDGGAAAAAELQALAREHVSLHVVRLGRAVPSTLVFDNIWVTGDFDWLGHRSGRPRPVRHENGALVRVPEAVDAAHAAAVSAHWPAP